jgi:hypothetical protein
MRLQIRSGIMYYGHLKLGSWTNIEVHDQIEFWMAASRGYKRSYYPYPCIHYHNHRERNNIMVEYLGAEWKLKKEHPV